MADDADITQDRMEAEAAIIARQVRKPAMPKPNGRCLYCDDPAGDHQHFCSTECSQDWQREQSIKRAQGLTSN